MHASRVRTHIWRRDALLAAGAGVSRAWRWKFWFVWQLRPLNKKQQIHACGR